MTIGPIVAGAGLALLTRVGAHASYVTDVLPALLVFALGLSCHGRPADRDRRWPRPRRTRSASPRR